MTPTSDVSVDVLMATYNGGNFIDLQIASILAQDHRSLRLMIRDDDSTDDTPRRIAEWAARDPRLTWIRDGLGRLGAPRNFLSLLRASGAPVVLFADQDDVWLSTKISRSLAVLAEQTSATGRPRRPTLLVSDAVSFEEGRGLIGLSTQRARPTRLEDFLFLNGGFYGCCMVLDRALVDRVLACRADTCVQHDHLVSLVALTFGRVIHLDERLMFYRRHSANVSGGPTSIARKVLRFITNRTPIVPLPYWKAIDSFFRAERDLLADRDRRTLERFLAFPSQARWRGAWTIMSHPFRIYGTRAILLAKLLFRPRS